MKISIQHNRIKFVFSIYAIFFTHLTIMIVNVQCDWLMECGNCKCKWNSGKKTADCKNLTLSRVPDNLSTEIQVLDLSMNPFKRIIENSFNDADLLNLHKLWMRNCSMERIHPLSFRGLEILIELDISFNQLKQLPKDAFSSLVKVRSLIINNNKLEKLENGIFRNLKYLHKIELKENLIHSIGTEVYVNLPVLTQIFLDDNKLNFLRKESFERLKRLASLSLDSNPWNCTCELQPFRHFVLKRNLYTPPNSCYWPAHLRGTLWNDDSTGAFACKPKIIFPNRGASINTSKENVTLVCRVHASPNTIIAWDYNKQLYSSSVGLNYPTRIHVQLLREEQVAAATSSGGIQLPTEKEIGRDVFTSRLTIVGAEKSDEGIYTCLAENPGGKDEVQMSLLVQKNNGNDLLLFGGIQQNVIIIIGLLVVGLISASMFLAMLTCCIYKRFKLMSLNNNSHHMHGTTVVTANGGPMHNSLGETLNSIDGHKRQTYIKAGEKDIMGSGGSTGSVIISAADDGKEYIQLQSQNIKEKSPNMRKSRKFECNIDTKNSVGFDLNENGTVYLKSEHNDNSHSKNQHYRNFENKGEIFLETTKSSYANYKTSPLKLTKQIKNSEINTAIGCSSATTTVDYQPDLLPYQTTTTTTKSISLSNSNLFPTNSYVTLNQSVNNDTESAQHHMNRQLQQQLQQQQQQQHFFNNTNTKESFHNNSNHILSTNDQILSRYNRISNKNKYNTNQTSDYLHPTEYNARRNSGDSGCRSNYADTLLMSKTLNENNSSSSDYRIETSHSNNKISLSLQQLYENNDYLSNVVASDSIVGDTRRDQDEFIADSYAKHSMVTTSPSLNILTNYYPRRELL